jgi:hypothetical protein
MDSKKRHLEESIKKKAYGELFLLQPKAQRVCQKSQFSSKA